MRAEDSIKDVRLKKMEQMRVEGRAPYPNEFRPTTTTGAVLERFGEASPDDLEGVEERRVIHVPGRLVNFVVG